jgi:protease-4
MVKSGWQKLIVVVLIFIGIASAVNWIAQRTGDSGSDEKPMITKNAILHMELDSPIWNGKRFLKNLKKYREDDKIKAILIEINSPGGAVGPSQELFSEIKRTKEEFKKPIICVSTGLIASGAYYAAAACDKLVVSSGALVGSIGVIMEFANLERLYDWAKVSRYSITSGKFKDSGAEYRSMREDERALFQEMIDEVYLQFRTAVQESRKLSEEKMKEYADGRVFTGAKAVEVGFADSVGGFEDAVKIAAEAAGLEKDDYDVMEIPKKKRSIWDLGQPNDDDNVNSMNSRMSTADVVLQQLGGAKVSLSDMRKLMGVQNLNQPLYLMPGYWQE